MANQSELQSQINDRLTNLEHEAWGVDYKGGCRLKHIQTEIAVNDIRVELKETRKEIRDVANFQTKIIGGLIVASFFVKLLLDHIGK